MEALSKDSRELPEEFLNSDALQNLPLQELFQAIEEIRRKLRDGDFAGAKEAAMELLRDLNELLSRLQQAEQDFDERVGQALNRLKNSSIPEIKKLIEEQSALLQSTEEMHEKLAPRLEEALSRQAGEDAGGRDGTGSAPTEAGVMSAEEKTESGSLALKEEGLRKRTDALAQEVAALKSVLPFLDPEVEGSLQSAAGNMGEAEQMLGEGQPGRARAPERTALAELMRARNSAGNSLREMGRMQGMRLGKAGRPIFMMGAGGKIPGKGSSLPTRGWRSGGRLGTDIRSFPLPGREDYQVPRIFREEVLESLREGYPAQYEDRIKDYYQRITE
jgi:hypothetical protein